MSTPLRENVKIGPKVSIFCVAIIIFQPCLYTLGHGIHLLSEDAPQITFTLSYFSKAVVVLEVCLGSLSCWNTALRPSLRREGIMLCFSMSQYMLTFMVNSMNYSSPVPTELMQLQTMTLPLPCLTVGKTLVFVLLTWLPPHTLDIIWTK